MNAVVPVSPGIVPATMTEAMKLAEMMATAKLVPKDLQKSPADCLLVIQQAVRWNMDPFAVAQECSVIQGKLMHSGKLVAAVVNSRGNLAERLSFSYSGEGRDRTIMVSGRLQGESAARTVTVRLDQASTNNRVWQSQPDQQLMYHGCRVWARRHTPELMLGVYSPEEFDEAAATPSNGNGNTIEHERHESLQIPAKRKSSAQSKRDGDWDKFQRALLDCQSAREVERLHEEYRKDVYPTWKQDWQDVAEEDFQKRLVMFSQNDLKQTLQESVDEVEEQDTPTPHQVMVMDECKAWINGAANHDDYVSRMKNKGLIEGAKTLTVFQRNKLRDYCKEVEERVRGKG